MENRKNIIYIGIIVLGLGYAGYSFLSGNSAKVNSGSSTLVKKHRAATDSSTYRGSIKKSPRVATKKAGVIKKTAKASRKSIKKKPGRRGDRKTKKRALVPAA